MPEAHEGTHQAANSWLLHVIAILQLQQLLYMYMYSLCSTYKFVSTLSTVFHTLLEA